MEEQYKTLNVDSKSRIYLPDYTNFSPQEELAFFLSLDEKYLILATDERHDRYLETLFELKNIDYHKLFLPEADRRFIRHYAAYACKQVEPDKQRWVTLPSKFINHLHFTNKIFTAGYDKVLKLYPSEEIFREEQEKRHL